MNKMIPLIWYIVGYFHLKSLVYVGLSVHTTDHVETRYSTNVYLQARTCQILLLAENPRWSRVWQYLTQEVTLPMIGTHLGVSLHWGDGC